MIRVENIEKSYHKNKKSEVQVLHKINIDFPEVGLVSIVGKSGSGKTTLLKTISGLIPFDRGRVVYEGNVCLNAKKGNIEEYANKTFAFVFRNSYMKKELSVEQNLYDALAMYGLSEEAIHERIAAALEIVGMERYKNRIVGNLSGGQAQRIAIARAIIKSPKIIFADEPTGNLDEENTVLIMQILKSLSKHCLVILVSHERRMVDAFSDRIIEIDKGQVIYDVLNESSDQIKPIEPKNIYLGDYQKIEEKIGNICVQLYDKKKEEQEQTIKIIRKNNKLFLQSSEEISILEEENDIQVIDGKSPDYYAYHKKDVKALENIINKYKKRLSLSDFRKRKKVRKKHGRHQLIQNVVIFIFTVFLFLLFVDYREQYSVNKQVLQRVDDHLVSVDFRKENASTAEMESFYDNYMLGEGYTDISPGISQTMNIQYDGYFQLIGTLCKMNDFSVISINTITNRDLVLGRLPRNRNEIVIDRMLLGRVRTENNLFKELFTEDDSVLGMKVTLISGGPELKIVGISDMDEPSVYVSSSLKYSMSLDTPTVATVNEMAKLYPEKYNKISLQQGQVLVSRDVLDDVEGEDTEQALIEQVSDVIGENPEIKGYFDDKDIDYIVSEEQLNQMIRKQVFREKKCQVYVSDPAETIERWEQEILKAGDSLHTRFYQSSEAQLKQEAEKQKKIINIAPVYQIMIILIFLLCLIIVVRGNMLAENENMLIDRLLGVPGRSICLEKFMDELFNTMISVVPVSILGWGIVRFCNNIPSLNYYVDIPLWLLCVFDLLMISVCIILALVMCVRMIKRGNYS